MTKSEALKTLILLSSMESWVMSVKVGVPEPLREDLAEITRILTDIVLGGRDAR